MTKQKRLPKINNISGYGGGSCYTRDNGAIAFGDPFDLIFKRDKVNEQQEEYRDLFRSGLHPLKDRKKMLRKNALLEK